MTYQFNPHRHVKIWLSKDRDSFLNLENQLRLIKMRSINPSDEIHLIYDRSLLSVKAFARLIEFCKKYKIETHDVQNEIIPACQSNEEKSLIDIYNDEIQNLDNGGNLGVASDVLRWLKSVYSLGSYSDFDTYTDTRQLPATIEVESSILLNIGSVATKFLFKKYDSVHINNDIIAVVDPEAADNTIKEIQRAIYQACSTLTLDNNPFASYVNKFENNASSELGEFRGELLMLTPIVAATFQQLNTLGRLGQGKTNRELRAEIIRQAQNNLNFCQATGLSIDTYASQQRNILQQQTGFLAWLLLPKKQFAKIKEMIAMSNEDLVTTIRENTCPMLLKNAVVYTSGPGRLRFSPFPNIVYGKSSTFTETVAPMAFAQYDLDKAFKSKQAIPLHAAETIFNKLSTASVGEVNDMSWLPEGQHATRVREMQIKASTGTLQRFFKQRQAEKKEKLPAELVQMRQLIAEHITKIQDDMNGRFGFYRNQARHKKIDALQGILSHFQDDKFDVHKFKMALSNYQSNEISASIGKSKTKKLIDRLTILSRQACALSITDKDGMIELPVAAMPMS